MNSRFLLPTAGFAFLAVMSFLLIVSIVIRPWGGPDWSWRTHLNLTEEEVDGYTRTAHTFVTADGEAPIGTWNPSECDNGASDCDRGPIVEWVVNGCAGCHGLDGTGSVVGPTVHLIADEDFADTIRFGPNGMPAFGEEDLSDEQITVLARYLQDARMDIYPGGVVPATPTPVPTATPVPTPEPTPAPTVAADASPAPTVVAPPADDEILELGRLVYEETAGDAGCAECHGLDGRGAGTSGGGG